MGSSLSIFCSAPELQETVASACKHFAQACLLFSDSSENGIFVDPKEMSISDAHGLFLLPEKDVPKEQLTMESIRPRECGWIDIRPGLQMITPVPHLILTSIDSESSNLSTDTSHIVRWIKKHFKSAWNLRYGVSAQNIVTGATGFYKDIGYTNGAVKIYLDGIQWKQSSHDRGLFKPPP